MTLNLGEITIEIKAKRNNENRFNKEATINFLNHMSMAFAHSSDYYRNKNHEFLSIMDYEISDNIYDYLKELGTYN